MAGYGAGRFISGQFARSFGGDSHYACVPSDGDTCSIAGVLLERLAFSLTINKAALSTFFSWAACGAGSLWHIRMFQTPHHLGTMGRYNTPVFFSQLSQPQARREVICGGRCRGLSGRVPVVGTVCALPR